MLCSLTKARGNQEVREFSTDDVAQFSRWNPEKDSLVERFPQRVLYYWAVSSLVANFPDTTSNHTDYFEGSLFYSSSSLLGSLRSAR